VSEFYKWWDETGSGLVPKDGEDHEEHACAIALLAWDAATKSLERQLAEAREELEDRDKTISSLGDLLTQLAVIIKGPEPENEYHDFSDLPTLCEKLVYAEGRLEEVIVERTTLRSSLERVTGERDGARQTIQDAVAVLENAAELNPSNYDHDDVCRLNAATVEAFLILKPTTPKPRRGG
jgi:hypothetical protein